MPYIKQEDRKRFDPHINALAEELNKPSSISPGEFNYVVSRLLWKLWVGDKHRSPSYTLGNILIGALECVKAEFYRRFLAPYEDVKIKENGDVKL